MEKWSAQKMLYTLGKISQESMPRVRARRAADLANQ